NAAATGMKLPAAAGRRLLEAVDQGTVKINSSADATLVLEVLEAEGPTEVALKQLGRLITTGPGVARPGAPALARRLGEKAAPVAEALWTRAADARVGAEERADLLATLPRVEVKPDRERWERLLADPDAVIRTEAVRWWRSFKGQIGRSHV